jgi:CRISPR/Cas system-associated protein Cas10 (large subunit of type III CRISPR-Cas system)
MRRVNELASYQAERQNRLASERRLAKINLCEIDESKKSVDSNQRILAEIREMRMEVENQKRQQATRSEYVPKDNWNESYNNQGQLKFMQFRGRGCQACK